MSISVKISQLNEGGAVASIDQIPVSRGASETVRIPASQFVVNGANIGVGTGQLYFDRSTGPGTTLQFRSLSGTDGIAVSNQGNTLVISASGQNPTRNAIVGNGTSRIFTITGATSVNPSNYRVDIDGVLQEPTADYSIVGSTIVFVDPPPNGSKVTVVSNNLVRVFDVIPSDGSVTPQKLSLGSLSWDVSGNVTIGHTIPGWGRFSTYSLVAGPPATTGSVDPNITHRISVGSVALDTGYYNSGTAWIQNRTLNNYSQNFDIVLQPNGGRVGINTTAPVAPLHITGTASSGETLRLSPVGGHNEGGHLTLMDSTGSGGWEIDNDGFNRLRIFRDKGVNNIDALVISTNGDITNKSLPFYGCRAWVNFDATRNAAGGTDSANTNRFIRASGNVTSVLQVAGGDYRITFTTPMPTADYCVTGVGGFANGVGSIGINTAEAPTTTTVRVRHGHFAGSGTTGFPSSPTYGNVAIFC